MTTGKLRIRNWEKFQQYRDREPKWIKVYRSLLRDYDFSQLSEVAQAQLLKLWLLAAETDNEIPNDEAWIKSQIGTKGKLLIEELVTHRFIELYNSVQNCTDLYTETERETERETEKIYPPFEAFYEQYPKKVDRKKAETRWKNMSKADRERALASIPKHASLWESERREAKYIKSPAVWLNGACWEDELDTAPIDPAKARYEVLRLEREELERGI